MKNNREQQWGFWYLLPIYPYQKRITLRQEVIKNKIWIFDQPHGFLYAVVPIRMTVIKLEKGGLLVYCPIAPTKECIKLVRELEAIHGQVKYIIHSTSSGLEHKIFVGPFARSFPQAQVWYGTNQWSFPLGLPLSWLGFPRRRTFKLPDNWRESPFADEFSYECVDVKVSAGSFGEVALLHRSSQTLLVTDAVIKIPATPPAIIEQDSFPMLFHARETALDNLEDNAVNRLKGWQRICLFALYFRPSMIDTPTIADLLSEATQCSDRSSKNYFGLFPFRWRSNWFKSFEAIVNLDIPLVAPILRSLILPQDIDAVRDWVSQISTWQFTQIIPAHFSAPIEANAQQFKQAFQFLESGATPPNQQIYPSGNEQIQKVDRQFIKQLEATLVKFKVVKPSSVE